MDLQLKRRKHARLLYSLYNKRYFGGSLPRIDIEVAPGKLGCNAWGETEWDEEGKVVAVRIGEANWTSGSCANHSFLKATMLHEQCHVKLGSKIQHDSPEWKAEVRRLSRLGALIETI